MIFVNNGAGGYVLLEHATWDGLFIGDLVFPCFIWIMGVCIPIALSSQLARGASRFSIARGILKASHIIYYIFIHASKYVQTRHDGFCTRARSEASFSFSLTCRPTRSEPMPI